MKKKEVLKNVGNVIYKTAKSSITIAFYVLRIGLVGIQLTMIILPLL